MPVHGERLKQMRTQAGLSQRELARRCKIGEKQIWIYENKPDANPPVDFLARIAVELRTSMDYLMGLSHNPDPAVALDELTDEENQLVIAMRTGRLDIAFEMLGKRVSKYLTDQSKIAGRKPASNE